MRSIAIGLAAAILAAALSPVAAFAADKPAKTSAADLALTAKNHDAGMKEAVPLAAQLGVPCTATDGNLVGSSKTKNPAGKDVTTKYYELACSEGLGWLVVSPEGGPPQAYDCGMAMSNKPKAGEPDKGQLFCRLPVNADPITSGAQPILTKAGVQCSPTQWRMMGRSVQEKFYQFEAACSQGPVYVLQVPEPGSAHKLQALDCLTLQAGSCEYFTKEKLIARMTALSKPAGRTCEVTNGRVMGALSTGDTFYEIGCADEKASFVLQMSATGQFVKSIDCVRANAIANGCTLSAGAASQTAETATYSKLAKQIGYACDVKAYHTFGLDKTGREVVELACNDHPDGALATLPVDKGQSGEYWNCVRAEVHQLQCALTPQPATFAKLAAQMVPFGKQCQVTKARAVGATAEGDDIVEVLCSDGVGHFIEYKPGSDSVKSVSACVLVKQVGGGCTLKP